MIWGYVHNNWNIFHSKFDLMLKHHKGVICWIILLCRCFLIFCCAKNDAKKCYFRLILMVFKCIIHFHSFALNKSKPPTQVMHMLLCLGTGNTFGTCANEFVQLDNFLVSNGRIVSLLIKYWIIIQWRHNICKISIILSRI